MIDSQAELALTGLEVGTKRTRAFNVSGWSCWNGMLKAGWRSRTIEFWRMTFLDEMEGVVAPRVHFLRQVVMKNRTTSVSNARATCTTSASGLASSSSWRQRDGFSEVLFHVKHTRIIRVACDRMRAREQAAWAAIQRGRFHERDRPAPQALQIQG